MTTLQIVVFVLVGAVILFFGWVWVMNRVDERRDRRTRAEVRLHRGLP